ncbi:MAG TPA: DUF1573 domain-containing protein [Opitutaceae bacterium]|nr:DUF1573 domain-containing protein [Opitutaceae bacterium]
MSALRLALLPLLLALSAGAAAGALTWSTTKVEATAKGGQESFATVFPFKNTGDKPVKITGVQTSCGCTTATLAKTTYAPGESGEVKAQMDLRERIGWQERTVTITTDDAPAAPTVLTLRVNIPQVIEIAPRMVVWSHDGQREPREVTITAGTDVAITLRDVVYSPQFTVQQITDVPGRRYRLRITPRSTDSHYRDEILVQYEAVLGQPQEMIVYAIVQ